MPKYSHDLIVIGSGPAGEKAAIEASKHHQKTVIVERRSVQGGVCLHTGTIPSKTLRETVVYIAGLRQRSMYGMTVTENDNLTIKELMYRKDQVIQQELDVIKQNMARYGIELMNGSGFIIDPHTVEVTDSNGKKNILTGEKIIISTGTRSYHPDNIDFNNKFIYDAENILDLDFIPQTLTIIGGGVIGCEFGSIFSNLGFRGTGVYARGRLLSFMDNEMTDALSYLMRKYGVTLILDDQLDTVEIKNDQVHIVTKKKRKIISDRMLFAAGRCGNSENIGLESLGIETDSHGFLKVNEWYQTSVDNIYAVGDVIGFPSLASVSMDQGRLAAIHAFQKDGISCLNSILPFGVFTIPAISMVGETEQSLIAAGQEYEVGVSRYFELARGQIINDHDGMLKLLFEPKSKRILGVHIIGERSTEIIHLGQAVMCHGGTLDYFVDTVFNYPTLGEAYKVAALDGLARLEHRR